MNAEKSTVIEEAIARLKFDGDQFNSGVSQCISTLDKLKNAIGGAFVGINVKAFDGLKNAIKSFTVSGMEKNIKTISDRFTNLGVVGTTVLQELTRKAVSFGLGLGNKVLSPLRSIWGIVTNKGWARASNVKQAEFMIKNLGLAWEKAKPDIDDAVNGTRFGFDEAATAAAQLATSGIKFGEDMPDVLKAIGNVASMTNTEFSDMAHIFTTMASNGRVYGEQLQQMSYRGLNATKSLADYLGKTEAQVKEMVSDGKVSFKDFYMAMNETFGDAAFKANETFSGVLANNKAVFARIGQVYASGFMDAAKTVLQHTQPKLKEIEKAIKPIGEAASSAMMAVAKLITPIVDRINVKPITDFVDKYIKPLKDYFDGVADKIDDVQNAAKEASMTAEELLEMANKVIRGDFGNGQERREKLEELGYSYERIQNKVNELLGCSFRYEVAEENVADAEKKAAKASEEHAEGLSDMATIVKNLSRFLGGLKGIWGVITQVGSAFYDEVIKRTLDNLPKIAVLLSSGLGDFGDVVSRFTTWIRKLDPVRRILLGIIGIGELFFGVVGKIAGGIANFFKEIGSSEEFQSVLGDIAGVIEGAVKRFSRIGAFTKIFFKRLGELKGVKRLTSVLGRAMSAFKKGVVDVIIDIFGKLHKAFNKESKFNFGEALYKFFFSDNGVIDRVANTLGAVGEGIEKAIKVIHGALFGEHGAVTLVKEFFGSMMKITKDADIVPASFKNLFGNSFGETVSNIGGKALEFIGGFIDKVKDLGNLAGVQKLAEALSTLFGVLKKEAVELLGKALEQLDKLLNSNMFKNNEFIDFFGEGGVIDTVTGIIGDFVEQLANAPDYIENFAKKVAELPSKFGTVGETILKFFGSAKTIFSEGSKGPSNLINSIFKAIKPDVAKDSLAGTFKEIFIDALDMASNYLTLFNPLAGTLAKSLREFLSSTKGDAEQAVEGLSGFEDVLERIKEKGAPVIEFLKNNMGFLNDLKLDDVSSILDLLKKLGKVSILFKVGKMLKAITGDIKKFGEVIDGFKAIPKSVSGVFDSVSKGIGSLSDALKNWGNVNNVFKQMRKKPLTTAFRDFAIGVGILVGAMALLGSPLIDYDRIRENCDVIAAYVAVMISIIAMLGLLPPGSVDTIGNFFAKLGVGLLLMTASIALFGKMQEDTLIQGGAAVMSLVICLAGAARLAGKSNPNGFIKLAFATAMLVPVVWLFGHMDAETLIQGGVAVIVFITAMARAAAIANSSKPGGFIAMSAALLLLVPSIWLLGSMKPEKLVVGGAAVITFMTSMAIAGWIAKGASGSWKSFISVAAAMVTLTGCMMILSLLKTSKLVTNAIVLNATLIIFTRCIKEVGAVKFENVMPNIITMIAVFAAISLLLTALTSFGKTNEMVSLALGLTVLIGMITVSMKTLSGLKPTDALNAAGAIGAFSLVIGAIIGIVATVLGYFGTTETGIKYAEGLGKIIRSFLNGLKGDDTADKAETLERAGGKLSSFGEKIKTFLDMLTGVDEGAATAAGILATAILKMTAAELLDSLSRFITSKIAGDTSLGGKLVSFGESLKTFLETTSSIDVGEDSHFKQMVTVMDDMITLANKLKPMGGILQELIGGPDLGLLGQQLSSFADGFNPFNTKVNLMQDVNDGKMEQISKGAGYMADVAAKLKNSDGKLQYIIGEPNLGKFGKNLYDFASGFNSFNTSVNLMQDIDKKKIGKITDVTGDLIRLSGSLQRSDGILQWVIGQKDLGTFGTRLSELGTGLVSYSDSVKNLNTEQMGKVMSLLMYMASFEGMSETINADTVPLIDCVTRLATSLSNWTQYTGDFNPEQFVAAVDAVKKLGEFFASLNGVDMSTADSFGAAMVTLAMTDTASFCSAFTDAADDAKTAVGIFLDGAKSGLEAASDAFGKAGESAGTNYGTGITSMTEPVKRVALALIGAVVNVMGLKVVDFIIPGAAAALSFAKGISQNEGVAKTNAEHMGANAVKGLDGIYKEFYKKGEDAGQGFADGLDAKMDAAVKSARDNTNAALDEIARVQDSSSPSKETRKLGTYFGEGYALGIEDERSSAERAARDTAAATLMAMMVGMQRLSNLIDDDLDAEPVIRPVFDPSGVVYGIDQANAMIDEMAGDMTYGMGSTISSVQNGEAARAQKYSELDYTSDMERLIDNTSRMITAIRENRYAIIDGDYVFDYVDTRMGQA